MKSPFYIPIHVVLLFIAIAVVIFFSYKAITSKPIVDNTGFDAKPYQDSIKALQVQKKILIFKFII